ncbi:DMT family transporter [Petrocella sp. FN5]|uniref:DMT family transporter n=1 Tax=Petrocella sp. FN5 TaxID=3032002 RepID=UPI0023DB92F7|nr:DMT family transporter [Petrocella sp. FN5]MDF1617363.1 DMT family transporter [Petrocella sp. FN5]
MKNFKTYLGLSALVVIHVIANNITRKNLLTLEPIVISMVSLFLATLVIWSLHFILGRRIDLDFKKVLTLSVGGIFGIAGFHIYLSMALEATSLDIALLFIGGIPLMTLVAALLIGKKTRFRNIFWVHFALLGVMLINIQAMRSMIFMPRTIGIMLLGNVCLVFYTLFNEKMSLKYELREIVSIQVTTGSITLILFYIYKMETVAYELKELIVAFRDLKTVGSIFFLVLFSICISHYFYNHALKKVGAVMTALFINLIPVINLLYKLFIDDNQLRFTGILGSLMILLSIYVIEDI